ncbi:HD domain-containing protein [Jidongwangia harbinensis]|uniref:HD domain-containing protein n=1 Tax=Jidongwangia harbinensis TaxID=2878561 RepID=UPI001CD9A3DD|nr:HD domain-containing protein [Jidongwangia harbinensis]MCA2216300.1 HD domain-containing protein [Jidongwangia harbinensis]MCA2217035.1 HD domain-containing protein [Jidongwangia harbinensis]
MPLHAVTEVHGEAGLRRRLTLELDHHLPGPAAAVVADAAGWAGRVHAGQWRTREPYLNHVLRVTLRMLCHYRVTDAQVLIAGLLHDSVEDQSWTVASRSGGTGPPPHEDAFAVIAGRYGDRVQRLVRAVTQPDPRPGTDRVRAYLDHLRGVVAGEPWARVLKLSDFTDNGVGIIHTTGTKLDRSARKYAPAVPVLRDLLHRDDTPLPTEVKQHIDAQLDLADHRFAAILAA